MGFLRTIFAGLKFAALYLVALPLTIAAIFGTVTIVLAEAAGNLSLLFLAGALVVPAILAAAFPGRILRTINYLQEGQY